VARARGHDIWVTPNSGDKAESELKPTVTLCAMQSELSGRKKAKTKKTKKSTKNERDMKKQQQPTLSTFTFHFAATTKKNNIKIKEEKRKKHT
jgi:hypothetical protein